MQNSEDMMAAAQAVLMPEPRATAGPTSISSILNAARQMPASGIREERVAAARARLAAGELPLTAEALADAILRNCARAQFRRD